MSHVSVSGAPRCCPAAGARGRGHLKAVQSSSEQFRPGLSCSRPLGTALNCSARSSAGRARGWPPASSSARPPRKPPVPWSPPPPPPLLPHPHPPISARPAPPPILLPHPLPPPPPPHSPSSLFWLAGWPGACRCLTAPGGAPFLWGALQAVSYSEGLLEAEAEARALFGPTEKVEFTLTQNLQVDPAV
jgi:hypothetical protein